MTSWHSLTRRRKWSCKCSMGERSGDLAGHCNTLWMGKMPRTVWTGLIMLENPTLCCCKYGTTTGSIIPSHQSNANVGMDAFNQAACSLFLTVLSQTLVPIAFLGKRPIFRLERNLLRRDEVVRKRSSCGVVLRGLPDLVSLGPSQFAEICSVVDLLLILGVGNARQCLLPTGQR